jgi:hypothetical protein
VGSLGQYLTHPVFWLSVVVVAIVINYVWMKFLGGKGKLA